MPVIAYSLVPPQRPSCAVLVLSFFRFVSVAQLVLILVFFQKQIGSWELVADVTHLFFSDMLLLWLVFILGPFARNGLFPLPNTVADGSAMLIWNAKFWPSDPKSDNSTTLACGSG